MALSPEDRRRFLRRSVRERLRLADEADEELRDVFGRVRGAVADRAEAGASTLAGLLALSDLGVVSDVIQAVWRDSVVMGVELAADQLVTVIPSGPGAPWLHVMEQEASKRIKGINAETMERVGGYVRQGVHEGWSPQRLAREIRADPSHAFDRTRSLVIARTETAQAYNRGSLAGYRATERVQMVHVYDGDECSWPEGHGDPPFADGMIVTLEEAEDHPIAHPNCVRAFSPVTIDEAVP